MNENKVHYFKESEQMREAYRKAQDTFKYFWRELYWERHRVIPALSMVAVKVLFTQEDKGEHMWIDDVDFDGFNITGVLMNVPEKLTNVAQGDTVNVELDEITDWLFSFGEYDGNKVYGGFTVQVLRASMSEEERQQHDEAWGLDFGDPNKILLAHGQEEHPENLIEHPMSLNMRDKLREFLEANQNEINAKDEQGYTMLHREAVAGNRSCAEVLLEMGANKTATTKDGHTAFDLANELKWEHMLAVLGSVN
ncbi:MAG: DUF2314 domain-containing protein [Deferribacteraceae bacterium]|jgi:uncharacterized protein YegJ (DUF2314 family)|nr:DUF2314 domain-containing protein [Deferribacteraceae bacterium]